LEAARPRALEHFGGPISDVADPFLLESGVVAVVATDSEGRLHQTGLNTLRAATLIATFERSPLGVLMLVPVSEPCQRRAIAHTKDVTNSNIVLLPTSRVAASDEVKSRLLVECLYGLRSAPQVVVGEAWTENAFATLCLGPGHAGPAVLRARRIDVEDDRMMVETSRLHNKLRLVQNIVSEPAVTWWIHLSPDAEIGAVRISPADLQIRVERWTPRLERFYARQDIQQLLEELKAEAGVVRLSDADFIIDVGFGVGNRDGYEAVIDPLEACLRSLGVQNVLVGGSRKVTEELHLLPPDRQIGQSGVSVNPQVLLAIGVSGAPQHLNYIGSRATILAFNRDPEAPIMILNQLVARPKVFPIVGDLFETVPAFISALKEDLASAGVELNERAPPVPA
jgi:electron transfer flavoprotein alpha subunit